MKRTSLPMKLAFPNNWIEVEKYNSESVEEDSIYRYTYSTLIENFHGYSWIYENQEFIANYICGLSASCLEILYKNTDFIFEEFNEEV